MPVPLEDIHLNSTALFTSLQTEGSAIAP